MAYTGDMEHGVFVSTGADQGSMEHGVFVAAGLLGEAHHLWVKLSGVWTQVLIAYTKVTGTWLPIHIDQKVLGLWSRIID